MDKFKSKTKKKIRMWCASLILAIVVSLFNEILFSNFLSAAVFSPKTFTLNNGLQVVVIENRRAPIVIQMIWYRIGAADEPNGSSGLAHFVEHLLFKGTKTIKPGQFSRMISRLGGIDNAFTSHDFTAYFQKVVSHELEKVMRLEADRMENLVLTDGITKTEIDVILEERRSRIDINPRAKLREIMRRVLYLNHPYGRPVVGWENEIKKLTKTKAMAFYQKYYVPNNAILIIAGDVVVEKVRRLAEKYYGRIPGKPLAERVRPKEPMQIAGRRVILKNKQVKLPYWSRYYLTPSYASDDQNIAHSLEILAQVFGGGPTSKLYKSLVLDKKIASGVRAWFSGDGLDYGELRLFVHPKLGINLREIESAITKEIKLILKGEITEEEFLRAKELIASEAVFARDGLESGPYAIGASLTQGRSIRDVESWPDRIISVSREQVISAGQQVLKETRSVTGILLPENIND